MKKILAIMLGVMLLTLAACGNDSEPEEANGEEGDQPNEEMSEDQESEIDMKSLIDQIVMDATVDTTSDTATFHLSLENAGEESVILGFTSSQKYEIQVENAEGENVYTFSADKMFTQELTTEELGQGEAFEAKETWTGIEEAGNYQVTMSFLVNTINDQPLEANPFQVTQTFTIEDEASTDESEGSEEEPSTSEKYSGDGQAFRDIEVTGENGSYIVKGEARVFEGNFLYTVEDGHNVHVEPTAVQVDEGAPSWSKFSIEIDIPQAELPDYGTLTLSIFEESAEDGKPTNVNYIPLEEFQMEE